MLSDLPRCAGCAGAPGQRPPARPPRIPPLPTPLDRRGHPLTPFSPSLPSCSRWKEGTSSYELSLCPSLHHCVRLCAELPTGVCDFNWFKPDELTLDLGVVVVAPGTTCSWHWTQDAVGHCVTPGGCPFPPPFSVTVPSSFCISSSLCTSVGHHHECCKWCWMQVDVLSHCRKLTSSCLCFCCPRWRVAGAANPPDWKGKNAGSDQISTAGYVYNFTFNNEGVYKYRCCTHLSGMLGTIVVSKGECYLHTCRRVLY